MKKILLILIGILFFFSCKKDKEIIPLTPYTKLDLTFGTLGTDLLVDGLYASVGEYIAIGSTNGAGAGLYDGWLVKFDSEGDLKWQQTFGGTADDYFSSIIKTSDNGFLITGTSFSNSVGLEDVWLLKLNATGLPQWEKRFGGTSTDLGMNSVQISDGTFIVSATTLSKGEGSFDHWLLKVDGNGNLISDKTFGTNAYEAYAQIMQKPDGNFFISGVYETSGNRDFQVMEINSNLDSLNKFGFGSLDYEEAKNIVVLSDGNFLVSGHSAGFGHLEHNFYAIKFDGSGNKIWENNYGTIMHDGSESSLLLGNGKVLLTGRSMGNTGMNEDMLYVVIDENGNEKQKFFRGGAGIDEGFKSILIGKDVFSFGKKETSIGNTDAWISKLNSSNF